MAETRAAKREVPCVEIVDAIEQACSPSEPRSVNLPYTVQPLRSRPPFVRSSPPLVFRHLPDGDACPGAQRQQADYQQVGVAGASRCTQGTSNILERTSRT